MIALAREAGRLSDPLLRQDIAKVISYKRLNALNHARAKADLTQGSASSIMSLGKLAMSRILHEEARVRTAILGAGSLLEGADYPRAEDANFLNLNAAFTSIGGGTDSRSSATSSGERVLGLPKEPEVDQDDPASARCGRRSDKALSEPLPRAGEGASGAAHTGRRRSPCLAQAFQDRSRSSKSPLPLAG